MFYLGGVYRLSDDAVFRDLHASSAGGAERSLICQGQPATAAKFRHRPYLELGLLRPCGTIVPLGSFLRHDARHTARVEVTRTRHPIVSQFNPIPPNSTGFGLS